MNENDLVNHNQEIVNCRKCPRLVSWREKVAREKRKAFQEWEYWGKPVTGFGDYQGRVLVVGLAPGAHGSNRTGRMFTGDASGDFLFPALHRAGFANQSMSTSREDGLILRDLYITAIGRCAPPDNKPTKEEIKNCQPYFSWELKKIIPKVIVALGRIAFEGILDYDSQRKNFLFKHGNVYKLNDNCSLVSSYHPSRQNTQTGRLTVAMFDGIWKVVRQLLQ